MSYTDRELVALCKQGDRQAFNSLVERYQSKVINIAYGMLQNADDADDAAQEVFIRVYRSINGFKEDAAFSTWLYRITVNICTDMLRKSSKLKTVSIHNTDDTSQPEFDIKDTSHTPDEAVVVSETQREVRRAISALKPEYARIIVLYDIEGFSYDEISSVLKIPVGTVKSRLSRARGALKKELMSKKINGNFF